MADSMKDIIDSNWKVCSKILDVPESVSYADEKKVLATINRNIYHKKPMLEAIRFFEVSSCHLLCYYTPTFVCKHATIS